jgi:hypothetical protein
VERSDTQPAESGTYHLLLPEGQRWFLSAKQGKVIIPILHTMASLLYATGKAISIYAMYIIQTLINIIILMRFDYFPIRPREKILGAWFKKIPCRTLRTSEIT